MRVNKRLREIVIAELAVMSDPEFRRTLDKASDLRRRKKETSGTPKREPDKPKRKPGPKKKRGRKPKKAAESPS